MAFFSYWLTQFVAYLLSPNFRLSAMFKEWNWTPLFSLVTSHLILVSLLKISAMSTTELQMSIIEKLMVLSDKALEKINSIAEQEINQISLVPDSHYEEVERRWQAYKNGETTSSSWEDVKERILNRSK